MAKWESRGYVFITYNNDHRPYHVHIFDEKGQKIGRFDLENKIPMDNFMITNKLRRALNDCCFIPKEVEKQ